MFNSEDRGGGLRGGGDDNDDDDDDVNDIVVVVVDVLSTSECTDAVLYLFNLIY